jgi:hypothetical protein
MPATPLMPAAARFCRVFDARRDGDFREAAMRSTPPDASSAFLMHALTPGYCCRFSATLSCQFHYYYAFQFSAAAAALLQLLMPHFAMPLFSALF